MTNLRAPDQKDPPSFAGKLVILRKQRRLSQREAARAIGISPSHLSKLENGQIRCPNGQGLRSIAKAYGCSTDTLLDSRTTDIDRQILLDSLLDSLVELDASELKKIINHIYSLRLGREEQAFLETLSPGARLGFIEVLRRRDRFDLERECQLKLASNTQA